MGIFIGFLRVVEVLVCLLLVGVILLQRNKGQGAGVSFGGGSSEAVFGAQAGDVLTRTTVILGIVFLVNTLVLSILIARMRTTGDHWLDEGAVPAPIAAPAAATGDDVALPLGASDDRDIPVSGAGDALDLPIAGEAEVTTEAPAAVAVPAEVVPAEAVTAPSDTE